MNGVGHGREKRGGLAVALALAAAVCLCGCGSEPAKTETPSAKPAAAQPAPEKKRPVVEFRDPKGPDAAGAKGVGATAPQPTAQTPPQPVPQTPAAVGAGVKGHGYGQGIIATPAAAYWRARERVVFDIQIPEALKIYKAMDPNGRGPRNHEEFVQKILEPNHIRLPELPPRQSYKYDADAEQLMILKPEE
jgi:hypothetical protein